MPLMTLTFFAIMGVIMYTSGARGAELFLFGAATLAISLIVIAFSRLTIAVSSDRIAASFGWGWPNREFAIADISSVERVRNKWWYGLGVRKVPGGAWMFNIWGLDAIELNMRTGAKFRLGTDDIDNLHTAISLNL